jgi:cold shock CspA family protein
MSQSHTATATQSAPSWKPKAVTVSTIKWYDPVRRFGFISPHDGGGDIWFNWLTLLRNKIDEQQVMPDMTVEYTFQNPDSPTKQRSVVFMKLDI